MKVGENILIVPAPNARQRTKNRLREHGPGFKVRAVKKSVRCFNGAAGVFLDAPDGWFGWLRLDEIVVDK